MGVEGSGGSQRRGAAGSCEFLGEVAGVLGEAGQEKLEAVAACWGVRGDDFHME